MTREILATALLAAFVWGAAPAAAEPSALDRAAIQAVISEQIAAFERDDGEAAFAFAARPIRELFPTPEAFLAMVRKAYAPVYRPKTVVFGALADEADGPEQEVLIADSAGVDWVARYTLVRDESGAWRIVGCRHTRSEGGAA